MPTSSHHHLSGTKKKCYGLHSRSQRNYYVYFVLICCRYVIVSNNVIAHFHRFVPKKKNVYTPFPFFFQFNSITFLNKGESLQRSGRFEKNSE